LLKQLAQRTRKRILKAVRERKEITYTNKSIKITTDSHRNLKSKKGME
jgi:hypothetical protein